MEATTEAPRKRGRKPGQEITIFTDTLIRNLDPGEYYDGKTDGLGIRVSPHHRKTFFIRRIVHGRQVRRKLGVYPEMSLGDARKEAKKKWQELEKEPQTPKKKPLAFRGAAEKALLFMSKTTRPRTIHERERILRAYLGPWKDRPVDSIDRDVVVELLEKIERPVMKNRTLSLIRAIFNALIDLGLTKENPALSPKRLFDPESPRDRLLTTDEMKAILKAAQDEGPEARAFMVLVAFTTMRAGAIARAKWDHVDLSAKTWRIPPESGTKFKDYARVVPLNHGAMEALQILAEVRPTEGYLFPARAGAKQEHFSQWGNLTARLRKTTGISDWTIHDWRTCFMTYGSEVLEIEPDILDLCSGRTPQGVGFKHYVPQAKKPTFRQQEKTRAMEAWGAFLTQLLEADTP